MIPTTTKTFPKGTKVTYLPTGNKGIVKGHPCENMLHVVFCTDLHNYDKYTAAATPISQLKKGWD